MFNHILLAVDGSEHSLNAAQTASQLARSMNSADLRIVVVYDSVPPLLGNPDFQVILNARLDETERILQNTVKMVGEIPARVHTETIAGDPAESIIKIAEAHSCDLIVMGSRGLGRLAGLVLGSTSQKVVSHAPCPVLIVR